MKRALGLALNLCSRRRRRFEMAAALPQAFRLLLRFERHVARPAAFALFSPPGFPLTRSGRRDLRASQVEAHFCRGVLESLKVSVCGQDAFRVEPEPDLNV